MFERVVARRLTISLADIRQSGILKLKSTANLVQSSVEFIGRAAFVTQSEVQIGNILAEGRPSRVASAKIKSANSFQLASPDPAR